MEEAKTIYGARTGDETRYMYSDFYSDEEVEHFARQRNWDWDSMNYCDRRELGHIMYELKHSKL